MHFFLIWIFASQFGEGCKLDLTRNSRRLQKLSTARSTWLDRVQWGGGHLRRRQREKGSSRAGRREDSGGQEICANHNTHDFRNYPILETIENVPSWQECGELSSTKSENLSFVNKQK